MAGARRHSIQWGFISLCHPGHSPLTQLSAPPLSGAPCLGFLNLPPQDWCIPAGHSAWVVSPHPPVLYDWRKEKAEKCSEGLWPWGAQCERWWWRRGCDAYLPLTHTAVIAQHFTIWWSTQQSGEDASLTCHLDWTDKHRGWTDPALTLSMNTPSSEKKSACASYSLCDFILNIHCMLFIDHCWVIQDEQHTHIVRINTNTHPNSYLH